MTLSLAPGEVRIYTDRVIDINDAVINPSVKADCLIYPSLQLGNYTSRRIATSEISGFTAFRDLL